LPGVGGPTPPPLPPDLTHTTPLRVRSVLVAPQPMAGSTGPAGWFAPPAGVLWREPRLRRLGAELRGTAVAAAQTAPRPGRVHPPICASTRPRDDQLRSSALLGLSVCSGF